LGSYEKLDIFLNFVFLLENNESKYAFFRTIIIIVDPANKKFNFITSLYQNSFKNSRNWILKMDLDRVHRWSIENCLAINPEKSQALLINPSILSPTIVSPLLLGTNQIAFVNKVKNLGIIFNQDLTWHNQLAKL
jgi:hypothetical protein